MKAFLLLGSFFFGSSIFSTVLPPVPWTLALRCGSFAIWDVLSVLNEERAQYMHVVLLEGAVMSCFPSDCSWGWIDASGTMFRVNGADFVLYLFWLGCTGAIWGGGAKAGQEAFYRERRGVNTFSR